MATGHGRRTRDGVPASARGRRLDGGDRPIPRSGRPRSSLVVWVARAQPSSVATSMRSAGGWPSTDRCVLATPETARSTSVDSPWPIDVSSVDAKAAGSSGSMADADDTAAQSRPLRAPSGCDLIVDVLASTLHRSAGRAELGFGSSRAGALRGRAHAVRSFATARRSTASGSTRCCRARAARRRSSPIGRRRHRRREPSTAHAHGARVAYHVMSPMQASLRHRLRAATCDRAGRRVGHGRLRPDPFLCSPIRT